jgi:hypothetical protein
MKKNLFNRNKHDIYLNKKILKVPRHRGQHSSISLKIFDSGQLRTGHVFLIHVNFPKVQLHEIQGSSLAIICTSLNTSLLFI